MISDDDLVAQRLREAVWADPESDAPRMVYADYLLEHGDPLGELIAVQLERARTGEAITERERALVTEHGGRILPPTAGLAGWSLARGFLAEAWVTAEMSTDHACHRAWSTLEQLAVDSASHPIFDNPHLRARSLHARPHILHALARRVDALPFRALADHTPHSGLLFQDYQLDVFEHAGAFGHVRALAGIGWVLERQLDRLRASRLFLQLEHLDLSFSTIDLDELLTWRRRVEGTHLARFSAHVPLSTSYVEALSDPDDLSESVSRGRDEPSAFAYFEIDCGGDQLIIQPDFDSAVSVMGDVVAVATAIAGDRARVIIEDHGTCEELSAMLRDGFADVSVRPPRRRAP